MKGLAGESTAAYQCIEALDEDEEYPRMARSNLRKWVGRVEVQLAATLLLLATPVLGAVLFSFLAYSANEMLEERLEQLIAAADAAVVEYQQNPDVGLDRGFYTLLEREEIAVRVSRAGKVIAAAGSPEWFDRQQRDGESLWDAVAADAASVLFLERDVAGSIHIEMAASLRDFVDERIELMTGLWVSLLVGIVGGVIFVGIATRRAMRPLREATGALHELNAHALQTRLRVRDTGDIVDRHALALNQALDRLEAGFERTRAFSANVAHELRTPINRLLNQSGAGLLSKLDPEKLEHVVIEVNRTAEEMEQIVEGLLLLAHADEGRLQTEMTWVRVDAFLENAADLYGPACSERGVALEISADSGALMTDETLLMRALCNLLDNALGHTPAGGSIRVEARFTDTHLELLVRDTGCGIREDQLERIFDRFHRVDASGQRPGAGLGLTISRAIAVALGGTLSVVSSSEAGTCFKLAVARGPARA